VAPTSHNAYTGRIVALVTIVVGFAGAALPVVANLDLSSTAGVIAGIVALCAVVVKYLEGWQRYEARLDAVPTVEPAEPAERPAPQAAEPEPQLEAEPEPDAEPTEEGAVVSLLPDDPEDEPADVMNRPADDELDDDEEEEPELAETG
jgi:hypothetical protein